MDAKLYNTQGKETGTVTLPVELFGLPWNADLVHQVVTSMRSSARGNTAHTKGRGEVRGGGRKPWQQKGTGRARHGSSRSPIWRGGGVTHGPTKDKNYEKTVSRQMRQKALLVTLSKKAKDGELIFVDSLAMQAPKAAAAKAMLLALGKSFVGLGRRRNAALVVLPMVHKATQKSFGNFGNIEVSTAGSLNPAAILGKKYVIIAEPDVAINTLMQKRVVKKDTEGKNK